MNGPQNIRNIQTGWSQYKMNDHFGLGLGGVRVEVWVEVRVGVRVGDPQPLGLGGVNTLKKFLRIH